MFFEPERIYHVYNRGNNNQKIFFINDNYYFFLRKIKKHLTKYCELLAYCLMPNHFHFMIYTKAIDEIYSSDDSKSSDEYNNYSKTISNAFAIILRSYTRAVNIQENRTGSIFQQKTKARNLIPEPFEQILRHDGHRRVNLYPYICLNYIHQNPLEAGIVDKMEEWEFSSFNEYLGKSAEKYCNTTLAFELIDQLDNDDFYKSSYYVIDPKKLEKIL